MTDHFSPECYSETRITMCIVAICQRLFKRINGYGYGYGYMENRAEWVENAGDREWSTGVREFPERERRERRAT